MNEPQPCLLVAAGPSDAPQTWRGVASQSRLTFVSERPQLELTPAEFVTHVFETALDHRHAHALLVVLGSDDARLCSAVAATRAGGVWTDAHRGTDVDEDDVRADLLCVITSCMDRISARQDGMADVGVNPA